MEDRQKEIITDLLFLGLLLFLGYLGYKIFSPSNTNNTPKTKLNSILYYENIEPCYNANINVKSAMDKLIEIIGGFPYDSKITLCVLENKEIYCIDSSILQTNGVNIVYFADNCYIQKKYSLGYPKIIIPYEYAELLSSTEDIKNLYENGYIYVEDPTIIENLLYPENYFEEKLNISEIT